jgi:hypothetical protein
MGYLRRKIKGYTAAIGIFSLIVIVTSSGITNTSINYFDINHIRFAYGQANQMSSDSDPEKFVRVLQTFLTTTPTTTTPSS